MTDLPPRGLPYVDLPTSADDLLLRALHIELARWDYAPPALSAANPYIQAGRRALRWALDGKANDIQHQTTELAEAQKVRAEYRAALKTHIADNERYLRERGSVSPSDRARNTADLLKELGL